MRTRSSRSFLPAHAVIALGIGTWPGCGSAHGPSGFGPDPGGGTSSGSGTASGGGASSGGSSGDDGGLNLGGGDVSDPAGSTSRYGPTPPDRRGRQGAPHPSRNTPTHRGNNLE